MHYRYRYASHLHSSVDRHWCDKILRQKLFKTQRKHLFGVIVPEGYSTSGREDMSEDRENMVGRAGTWMVRLHIHSGNREKKKKQEGELGCKVLTPVAIARRLLKPTGSTTFPDSATRQVSNIKLKLQHLAISNSNTINMG